jgi:predicted metal-dependent hydrolase
MEYDPRYLAGIVLFNDGDFFEAHEVWESLWMETAGDDKRFYQGLIQAAVSLCHFCNGNLRGARKLFLSGRDYMARYGEQFMGLNIKRFWCDMEQCYQEVLATADPDRSIKPKEDLIPTIEIDPAPGEWPDPKEFLDDGD